MEIWARLRYARLTVQQYDSSKRLVMLSTDEFGDELIPLPQEVLFSKVGKDYIPPDVDQFVIWNSQKVNEILDDEGYMYWIPDSFKENGKYFLIPSNYFYSQFYNSDSFINQFANEQIEKGNIEGLLVRMVPKTILETITGMRIEGWSISGKVSGALDSGNTVKVLTPKDLIDPKRIDQNLTSKQLVVYFYYEEEGVDLAIEAKHLTIFYKK